MAIALIAPSARKIAFIPSLRMLQVGGLIASCAVTAFATENQAPELSIGNRWTYRMVQGPLTYNPARLIFERTVVVQRRTQDFYLVAVSVSASSSNAQRTEGNRRIAFDLNWLFRQTPDMPFAKLEFLKWPLTPGQKWTFAVPQVDGVDRVYDVEVREWEQISVPAGTFRAIAITAKSRKLGGGPAETSLSFWFSPDVKAILKEVIVEHSGPAVVRSEDTELVSYDLK